jgi:acetyltransferase-like isoleucine patch superfamily enzyme
MNSSFYEQDELRELGIKHLGTNVMISRKCSIYGAENMSFGSNVRIDDFCILSGNIIIGDYVHIAAGVKLYASSGIKIGNFCGISANSIIYTVVDDFSGKAMISPMVATDLCNQTKGLVTLNDYVQLGANTIVFPNITFGEGAVTGAFSLVNKPLEAWTVNIGIPCKFYKARSADIKKLSLGLL